MEQWKQNCIDNNNTECKNSFLTETPNIFFILSFCTGLYFLDFNLYSHLLQAKKINDVRKTSMVTVLYVYTLIQTLI